MALHAKRYSCQHEEVLSQISIQRLGFDDERVQELICRRLPFRRTRSAVPDGVECRKVIG